MKTTERKIEELEKQLQELKNEVATQNQQKFKKGDILAEQDGWIYIFDSIRRNVKTDHNHIVAMYLEDGDISISNGFNYISNCIDVRLATEAEKQQLIDKLRKNGKDWDAEKCEIVDYRWRANKDAFYYYLMCTLDVRSCPDNYDACDNMNYNVGNYFKTKKLAEAAAEKVKKLLLTLKHS